MNNKKVKKFVSCVCALTLLFGAIPMNSIKAEAEDSAVGTTYYDVNEENPLQLHGVSYDETEQIFKRMDLDTAASIAGVNRSKYKFVKESYDEDSGKTTYSFSNNVYSHAREAAGGRIRFSTDSSHVSIQATLQNWYYQYATSMKDGKYGFDVYVDTTEGSTYAGTITVKAYPTTDGRDNAEDGIVQVEGTLEFDTAETRNLTIYFPITIETKSVKVGVATGSTIAEHTIPYQANQKIVFYGSSITQGGAVTKPGNTYVNTVGRNLNMEYHSLGMWGSAKGQLAFAEYIADPNNVDTKNMTAFVFDYDHNNATVKDLDGSKIPNTKPVEWTEGEYYPFYETIRAAYPNIPIILVTRPNNHLDVQNAESPDEYSTAGEMKAFIRAAYERAKADGDANIHFVDGESFFNYSTGYLADNVHPNDAGQARMAEVMTAVLERAFAGEKNICVEPQVDCADEKLNEDFTLTDDEVLADNWTVATANLVTNNIGIVDVAGDSACQIAYKRMVGETPTGYIQHKTAILRNCSDFAVEQDVTLVKNTNLDKFSYVGITFRDSGTKGTYETRVQATKTGCKVTIYDNSDYNTSAKAEYSDTIADETLANMFNNGTEFSYHIRVEMNTVTVGNGTKQIVFKVSVEDSTVTFCFVPESQNCAPTGLRVNMYGGSNSDTSEQEYKAIVDNIKVYKLSKSNTMQMAHDLKHVAEIPATVENTGVKAHYECDICGAMFLDEEGIDEVTAEDLVLAKCCSWFTEDFEDGADNWTENKKNYSGTDTMGIVSEGENSVYQLLVSRSNNNVSNYIYANDPVLEGHSDYTINLHGELYKADNGRWPVLSLMLKDRDSGYYEIQFTPKSAGCQVTLKEKTGDAAAVSTNKTIEDEAIAIGSKTKVSYDIQIVVDTYTANDGTTKVKYDVSIGESETVEFDITPNNQECTPTQIRVYLYSGSLVNSQPEDFKATIDNIQLYKKSHVLTEVGKVESTEDTAGTRAHYKCDDCGKKFSNSTAAQEVTAEALKYATLNDIMCQTRVNENGLTDIRFVAYVDDYTQYKSVTFKITLTESGKYGTYTCKNVYTAVKELDTMRTTDYLYSVDGYFAAFKLFNNTEAQLAEEMKIEVTWTDLEGNTKKAERTITISEEQQ